MLAWRLFVANFFFKGIFVSLCVPLSRLLPQCSLGTLWHCPRSSVQSLHTGGAAEGSLNPHHQRLVRPLPPHPDPGWLPHFAGAESPTFSCILVGTVNEEHMFYLLACPSRSIMGHCRGWRWAGLGMGTTSSTPSWWLQPSWESILRLQHQRFPHVFFSVFCGWK